MVKDLCFEIIEKCPNECKFCSSNSNSTKQHIIDLETFKRVINYFMEKGGIEELSLSGGEPLLHQNIMDMVRYAKSQGIRTVIFTSGVVFGPHLGKEEINYFKNEMLKNLDDINKHEPDNLFLKEKITKYYRNLLEPTRISAIDRRILKELYACGLDKIVFDMQAYESDTDSYLMGRTETSRNALLNSLFNAAMEKLNIDIHFVPMKPNYKEIIDILEILEIIKVKQISLLNFLPQGRGKINASELQLSEEERIDFFKLLEVAQKYFSGNIRIGIPLSGNEMHKCNAGIEKLDIKFDGTVLPCPAFKELTLEECEKYGIKTFNIYKNLEDVEIKGEGKRVYQLCKKVYSRKP